MSGWWSWITGGVSNMLSYMGLWKKTGRLVFLGLDNAGKTTLLHMLKDERMAQLVPTMYATTEELIIEGMRFTTFDVGGHLQVRKVWRSYTASIDGIVFIIDAFDKARIDEARTELQNILEDENVGNTPLLILGNKIDKGNAFSPDELIYYLGIQGLTTGKNKVSKHELNKRPLEVFMCSIKKREGYGEAFRWLANYI